VVVKRLADAYSEIDGDLDGATVVPDLDKVKVFALENLGR
jgi:hypothetical protein